MRFGSVCSGIEAASVAFAPLGWEAAWLAEVDVAASAVLAHRLGATAPVYPMAGTEKSISRMEWGSRVTNYGDMTRLPALIASGFAEAPDMLCGGTPCQAFSLAGRREGLNDARGNLTLTFVEIADAIDQKRKERGEDPSIIFWENVPGVLTDKTNAFGCFLAGLAGESVPLEPPRGKWSNAGLVIGPERAVAWVVKDAQYFGLAQRRARVFVVASAREGFDPAAVLFEFDGLRRDSAPSREAGQEIAGTLDARTSAGGFPGSDGACANHVVPARRSSDGSDLTPQWWDGSPVSQTLDAVLHKGQTMPEKNRFPAVLQPIPILEAGARTGVSTDDPRAGIGIGSAGDPMFTLQSSKQHAVAFSVALRGREGGATAELGDDLAGTLRASAGGGDKPHVLQSVSIVVHGTQDPCVSNDLAFALGRNNGGENVLAFSCKDYGGDASLDIAPTMRAMGHSGSHANAGGQLAVLPFNTTQITSPQNGANPKWGDPCFSLTAGNHPPAVCVTGDKTHALTAEGFDASEDGTGRGNPIVTHSEMAVRRLMPIEAERLQGFPDNWTWVPYGKRMAADGPRYKQLGNSWAVNCVAWIGRRIDDELRTVRAVPVETDRGVVWTTEAEIAWMTCP